MAEASLFTSATSVCGVCTVQYSKYKCPRCALRYCSLPCYRTHGEQCTEGFYCEHASALLKSDLAPTDQRIEMMKTLQRLESTDHGNDNSGDDEDGDSEDEEVASQERAKRLARLLEQSTIDECQLSADERAEFRRLLADGSLSAELQAAPVWWAAIGHGAVVRAAGSGGGDGGSSGGAAGGGSAGSGSIGWQYSSQAVAATAADAGAPPLPAELPPMQSLTSREPPAALLFNVLEVVCAYVYAVRLFCGDSAEDPSEAAACLLALSAVLSGEQKGAHSSEEEALLCFARACQGSTVATSAAFGAACLQDAVAIVSDGGLTALALAGASDVLTAAVRAQPRRKSRGPRKEKRSGTEPPSAATLPVARHAPGQPSSQARSQRQAVMAAATDGEDEGRASLLRAKKRALFLEAWWASRRHIERQAGMGSLQFGLRKELERREAVRSETEKTKAKGKPPPSSAARRVEEIS